jgi:hypothetical protein
MRTLPLRKIILLPLALAAAVLCAAPVRAADPVQLYRDAIKLYEKGDYDQALKGFLRVMKLDPSNAEAREYMLRCSQKIVEIKLGGDAADLVEKEVEAEKHLQDLAPDAPPALSEDYITPILPESAGGLPAQAAPAAAAGAAGNLPAASRSPSNARDLLAERSALTDDLRRRYLGKGNIIDVAETGGRLEVTFYLNRLFLPLSDALRPESYAILGDVVRLVQSNPKRMVSFLSVDNVSPAVRNTMADLSVRRTNAVFSYVLSAQAEGEMLEAAP